jgi:7-cyano-7-deazaguanine reductase
MKRATMDERREAGRPVAPRSYTDEHAAAGVRAPLPEIETWPNQYAGYEIEIAMPEFTSVCPKTGLPDFGKIVLRYLPDKLCLELKSYKMYLLEYRNLGIFQENAVNRILQDVVKAAKPIEATVIGDWAPRGGLSTLVTASWKRGSRGKR